MLKTGGICENCQKKNKRKTSQETYQSRLHDFLVFVKSPQLDLILIFRRLAEIRSRSYQTLNLVLEFTEKIGGPDPSVARLTILPFGHLVL
jgi:hypothetical protein